jgi:hypothetical protein
MNWRNYILAALTICVSSEISNAYAQAPARVGEAAVVQNEVIRASGSGGTQINVGDAVLRNETVRTGADARLPHQQGLGGRRLRQRHARSAAGGQHRSRRRGLTDQLLTVMPRESGASSTARPRVLAQTSLEYWVARSSRATTD